MKIALSQINTKIADFKNNLSVLKEELCKTQNEVLTVFPELSLSGSPLEDLTLYEDVFSQAMKYAEELSCEKKDFVFGFPIKENSKAYNALAFVKNGELQALSTKKNIGRFDKGFCSGNGFERVEYNQNSIAFGFLEDLEDFVKGSQKADLVICSANIVFELNAQQEVITRLQPIVRRLGCPLVVVNRCGAEGRFVFNGGSFVLQANGNLAEELPLFDAQTTIVETQKLKNLQKNPLSKPEKLYRASVLGIRDYHHKNNIKKAVIGLSGGIDSALVVVLAVEALGKENVVGVLLPSEYSTSHSVSDAKASAENLQIEHYTIPIKESFTTIHSALQPVFKDLPFGLAEENLQSRIRLSIIMGIANKIGAAMLNTTNKSETAVGYGTLYGDTSGGIAAIGDMYKTEVWELSRWINREKEIIPENSIIKAPSAELRPDQKDSDSLPDYDVLDRILYLHIEQGKCKSEIISEGFDEQTVEKILRLVKINEWKRHQVAPSLKVSSKTFGIDRIMPIS